MEFEAVIGLEIHVEMKTISKMFSSAPVTFGDDPNTQVMPLDIAFPGTMPVVNKQAVINAIRVSNALHMQIDHELWFDRKNYFYSDLPKGFQITQQARPIGSNGYLTIEIDGLSKKIEIERLHMEEDTCKQLHSWDCSLLDYNRAGIPLVEIVSRPDMRSGEEAMKYAEKAENLIPSDPAPLMIKYIANLNTDFNKSESFHNIANDMLSKSGSIIIDDDKYKALLATFFLNYMKDRDVDFKRVFANTKKVRPDDIKNIMRYENTKRTRYFVTHQELSNAMKKTASDMLAESSNNLDVSGQMNQSTWSKLEDYRNNYLFKSISIAILDPSQAPKAAEVTKKYHDALEMKWESAFKKDGVNGSKDQVRNYRSEAEVVLNTLKSIR